MIKIANLSSGLETTTQKTSGHLLAKVAAPGTSKPSGLLHIFNPEMPKDQVAR